MRIGQTSIIFYGSKIVGSFAGFLATLYIARLLGASVLGVYSVILAVVAWAGIAGKIGLTSAVQKRMSEGKDTDEFFVAGTLVLLIIVVVLSGILFVFRGPIEAYIGRPVIGFVVLLLFVTLLNELSVATLSGSHLVHIRGLLAPIRMTVRSVAQIVLVYLGFKLTGMLVGHALGYALVGVVGLLIVGPSISLPSRHHFESLISYAKYAWIGNVEGRAFGWIDVTVMGFFVSSDLIGVYSVGWTIGTFLLASGTAISNATFPEISNITADEATQAAAPIVRDSLRYAGIILIPGLIGGAILAPRILRIYGPEFTVGATVLTILIAAVLLRSYQMQLLTALSAIDRPDLTFNVNAVSIVSNVVLNVVLVYRYGWIGAAVATMLAVGIGTLLGYRYVTTLIDFELPYFVIGKQVVAAGVTGAVAAGGLWVEATYTLANNNVVVVLTLVTLGAGAYFAVLFWISKEFRSVVQANAPFDVPTLR